MAYLRQKLARMNKPVCNMDSSSAISIQREAAYRGNQKHLISWGRFQQRSLLFRAQVGLYDHSLESSET